MPIQAIQAIRHDLGPLVNNDAAAREAMATREEASIDSQMSSLLCPAFWISPVNEADVLCALNAFVAA